MKEYVKEISIDLDGDIANYQVEVVPNVGDKFEIGVNYPICLVVKDGFNEIYLPLSSCDSIDLGNVLVAIGQSLLEKERCE